MYYIDAKKATGLLQRVGLQLPKRLFRTDGYIHSIRDSDSSVKPKFENVTKSQQFKRWFGDWETKPNTASKIVNEDGTPNTAHSLNPVPFIYVTDNNSATVKDGRLADVAPSILHIMGLEQPADMTGENLIID